MSERVVPGPITDQHCFKEAVCISTDKVYDSCRDKDCLEDLRVYVSPNDQALINRAINVKCRCSEILWVYTDVEAVPFNKGYYTVDVKYFFRITLDVFMGIGSPTTVTGLATFDKKVILFGSEGHAKIYSSLYAPCESDLQTPSKSNQPRATVEVVDPICLNARLVEKKECCCDDDDLTNIPACICQCFGGDFACDNDEKRVYVSLGVFTIIRLERLVQLLIPAYDFCIPEKECVVSTEENPCELFETLQFPFDEFFPPERGCFNFEGGSSCGCGCN